MKKFSKENFLLEDISIVLRIQKVPFFIETFSFIHVLSKCWMMLMNSKETVEGKSQIIYTRNDKVDN